MIFCWFIGDIIKGMFYININAPIQLIWCMLFQAVNDILILFQFCAYKKSKVLEARIIGDLKTTNKCNIEVVIKSNESTSP